MDLRRFPEKRLSPELQDMQRWQKEIEAKAQAAQDEVDRKTIHPVRKQLKAATNG